MTATTASEPNASKPKAGRPKAGKPKAGKHSLAQVFGLKGDAWMRHANPTSVWTRFAGVPLLALAVWSRAWIGWFSLVPIVLSVIWLAINPLFFAKPRSTRSLASKGVLGERVWTEGERSTLPPQFQSRGTTIAAVYQTAGVWIMAYGLWVPEPGGRGGRAADRAGRQSLVHRSHGAPVRRHEHRNAEYASWDY